MGLVGPDTNLFLAALGYRHLPSKKKRPDRGRLLTSEAGDAAVLRLYVEI